MRLIINIALLLAITTLTLGCSERQDPPPPESYVRPPYIVLFNGVCSSEADTQDFKVICRDEGETALPIHLISTSRAFMEQAPEKWPIYEESGLTFLPERVYTASGYGSYPNNIGFTYTYKWLTVSTFKEPDSKNAILRLTWEANTTGSTRIIYLYIGCDEKCVVEVKQQGTDNIN